MAGQTTNRRMRRVHLPALALMAVALTSLVAIPLRAFVGGASHVLTARPHGSRAPARTALEAATLYDMPISNNGAKVRLLIYKKGLDVNIVPPSELGGLKSEEYMKVSPVGKMPALMCEDGTPLCESQVIMDYLSDKYAETGPSYVPSTPEGRAKAAQAARLADMYITSIQGAMYRGPMDIAKRAADIGEINKQLDILETVVDGPYIVGDEMSTADFSLFPTFVFMTYCLPRHFGWADLFAGRPKLGAWWSKMLEDADVKKVFDEVTGGLEKWEANGRWESVGIDEHVKDNSYKWAY